MADPRFEALADPVRRALHAFVLRRYLDGIHVTGLPRRIPPDLPILLCANHASGLDAWLLGAVARHLRPSAPFRAVVPERELRRSRLLGWSGAIGVEAHAPGSLRSALRAAERLTEAEPESILALLPRSGILPTDRRPLGFDPRIQAFRDAVGPSFTLPVALRLEPLAGARPTALVSVGAPLGTGAERETFADEVEARATEELDAIAHLLARHGDGAPAAWPGVKGRLPRARPGGRVHPRIPGPAPYPAHRGESGGTDGPRRSGPPPGWPSLDWPSLN